MVAHRDPACHHGVDRHRCSRTASLDQEGIQRADSKGRCHLVSVLAKYSRFEDDECLGVTDQRNRVFAGKQEDGQQVMGVQTPTVDAFDPEAHLNGNDPTGDRVFENHLIDLIGGIQQPQDAPVNRFSEGHVGW